MSNVPTDPSDDDPMSPAEFRVVREFLGLTGDWLGTHLNVTGRTVRAWEAGKYPIPDGVRIEIEDIEHRTGRFIDALIGHLLDLPEPGVITYRTDDEYHAAHPDIPFPASWHRAVIARVAQEVPGLSIAYASDLQAE